jgi:hypothetical protein
MSNNITWTLLFYGNTIALKRRKVNFIGFFPKEWQVFENLGKIMAFALNDD